MRGFLLFFVVMFLLSGCAQQVPTQIISSSSCDQELEDLQAYVSELEDRISLLEKENADMKKQLDDYYFTQITSDVDLLDWNSEEIMRGMILYNARYSEGGWWTYFYHLDTKNYYYQQGAVLPEDPFFNLRYKNSGQEYNISSLRIINIALGNRTLGDETWKDYLGKVLRETQVDTDLTCYQQTACRQIQVIKCNKKNQKLYVWSEGTNLFMSRNDEGVVLDTFQRFYCTQK
ncbi:MAG: hypothetical protein ABIH63_02825 [archaeon]